MNAFGSGDPSSAPLLSGAFAYAGFWVRTFAYFADCVILGLVGAIFATSLGAWLVAIVGRDVDVPWLANAFIEMSPLLLPALYFIGFWAGTGATPGKMIFGMMIVRAEDGGPISLGRAIGRFFGFFISSLVFGLGFLLIAFDRRKQSWHDKIADTVVVLPSGDDAVVFGRSGR